MPNKVTWLCQPTLFDTELTWDEIPVTVRGEVIQLLASMSIEITTQTTSDNEDQQHEPSED